MDNWTNTAWKDGAAAPALPARDWKQAMARGFRCRCPRCGTGRMFGRFLKVEPACQDCGEPLDGHRADDMPPYVTIMIVGHIIVPLNLAFEQSAEWPLWWHMALWPALTVLLALLLMQPVKGALIAYQWAHRMHGFDPAGDIHDIPSGPAAR